MNIMDHLDNLDIIYINSNNNNNNNISLFCVIKLIIFLIVFLLLSVGFLGFFCKGIDYAHESCFQNKNTTNNIVYI